MKPAPWWAGVSQKWSETTAGVQRNWSTSSKRWYKNGKFQMPVDVQGVPPAQRSVPTLPRSQLLLLLGVVSAMTDSVCLCLLQWMCSVRCGRVSR